MYWVLTTGSAGPWCCQPGVHQPDRSDDLSTSHRSGWPLRRLALIQKLHLNIITSAWSNWSPSDPHEDSWFVNRRIVDQHDNLAMTRATTVRLVPNKMWVVAGPKPHLIVEDMKMLAMIKEFSCLLLTSVAFVYCLLDTHLWQYVLLSRILFELGSNQCWCTQFSLQSLQIPVWVTSVPGFWKGSGSLSLVS